MWGRWLWERESLVERVVVVGHAGGREGWTLERNRHQNPALLGVGVEVEELEYLVWGERFHSRTDRAVYWFIQSNGDIHGRRIDWGLYVVSKQFMGRRSSIRGCSERRLYRHQNYTSSQGGTIYEALSPRLRSLPVLSSDVPWRA